VCERGSGNRGAGGRAGGRAPTSTIHAAEEASSPSALPTPPPTPPARYRKTCSFSRVDFSRSLHPPPPPTAAFLLRPYDVLLSPPPPPCPSSLPGTRPRPADRAVLAPCDVRSLARYPDWRIARTPSPPPPRRSAAADCIFHFAPGSWRYYPPSHPRAPSLPPPLCLARTFDMTLYIRLQQSYYRARADDRSRAAGAPPESGTF